MSPGTSEVPLRGDRAGEPPSLPAVAPEETGPLTPHKQLSHSEEKRQPDKPGQKVICGLCGLIYGDPGASPENGQLWTWQDPAQVSPITSPRKADARKAETHAGVSGEGVIKGLPSQTAGRETTVSQPGPE